MNVHTKKHVDLDAKIQPSLGLQGCNFVIRINDIMIRRIREGKYALRETEAFHKILSLEGLGTYTWIYVANRFYEILVFSKMQDRINHKLAAGRYRLYDVRSEPKLVDGEHLELIVGEGMWQGYILPTGLPSEKKLRSRIIPTKEFITKSTH